MTDFDASVQPSIPFRTLTCEEQLGTIPSQRSQIAFIPCPPRHSIFCYGGVWDANAIKSVSDMRIPMQIFELDLRTGSWTQHLSGGRSFNTERTNFVNNMWGLKGVYRRADHTMWLFGGGKDFSMIRMANESTLSNYGVYCLDLNTLKWSTKMNRIGKRRWAKAKNLGLIPSDLDPLKSSEQPWPRKLGQKRCTHALEMRVDQSAFVVFGGDDGGGSSIDDFSEFVFRDLAWREIEIVAGRRPLLRMVHASAMTSDDRFVIFGGANMLLDAEDSSLQSLAYFDFKSKTWFSVDVNYTYPSARFAMGLSSFQSYGKPFPFFKYSYDTKERVYNNYLILHGGRNDSVRFNNTFVYDMDTNEWKECRLVDDSISTTKTIETLMNETEFLTLSKERKMKREIIPPTSVIHRGGNIGCAISFNDLNFKASCLFYEYNSEMTTFSAPMVKKYPSNLSKKFFIFGGKTGLTGFDVYDSSLLTFELSHFDYQNDPSLLIDPTKSASTMALFEELSTKLWIDKLYVDYFLTDKDETTSFNCHSLVLSGNSYFGKLVKNGQRKTCLNSNHLEVWLLFCYGIELTPSSVGLDYHKLPGIRPAHSLESFIDLYCVTRDLEFVELLDCIRKLLSVTMSIEMAINLFSMMIEKKERTEGHLDLLYFVADYLKFNIEPTIPGSENDSDHIFTSEYILSQYRTISREWKREFTFSDYITRRVLLAREYMRCNLNLLMTTPELLNLSPCSKLLVKVTDDQAYELCVPSQLMALRFEYFANLLFNNMFLESTMSELELPSMVFYQEHSIHPLLSLAAIVYYAFTNDIRYEHVLNCVQIFPRLTNGQELVLPQTEIVLDENVLTQYVVDLYSVADFLSCLPLKESLLKYVRMLIATEVISKEKVKTISKELLDSGLDLLCEIADLFSDCEHQIDSLNRMEETRKNNFQGPLSEQIMFEGDEEFEDM